MKHLLQVKFQITATKLDEVKEQLGENSPYLEEVVNLLKFLQDTSDNPSPLDLENQRENNRERKLEQELDKTQIKLLEQIAENTGNLDEISGEGGGLLDGLLGGLGGLGGGLLGGAGGRGRGGIRGAISRAGGAVRGGLGRVGSVANRASGGRFGRLGNLVRNAGSGIAGRARSLVGGGLSAARGALGGIKSIGLNALKLGGGAVAGLAATGAAKTASAASSVASNVKNTMTSMPDRIKGVGSAIPDKLPKTPSISVPPKMPSVMDKITAPAKGVGAKISGLASKVTGKGAASVATKGAATAGKTAGKGLGKSLLKKIPGVGLIAGLGFGAQRAFGGDFSGAGLEVLSGLTSIIPGLGTAASTAIDAGLMAKDMGAFDGEEGAIAPEISPEDQKAELQSKIAEAKDRITRSEGGENVYWGRDSKGREEDTAEIEKLQAELDKLNITPKEENAFANPSAQEIMDFDSGVSAEQSFSSDVPNKKLEASNMMDNAAMDKSTSDAKQAANIINAPQQNTVNNVTNNSTIMPKQKPEVRHTDGAVRDARLSLVGAW